MAEDLTNPSHYQLPDGRQTIDVISDALRSAQFDGYLIGNMIKYALREGRKNHINQDMAKQFTDMLPEGNVALLKDDVVRQFAAWQNLINDQMIKIDREKKFWYDDRLKRRSIYLDGWLKSLCQKIFNN